jgi:hypothetical protein
MLEVVVDAIEVVVVIAFVVVEAASTHHPSPTAGLHPCFLLLATSSMHPPSSIGPRLLIQNSFFFQPFLRFPYPSFLHRFLQESASSPPGR